MTWAVPHTFVVGEVPDANRLNQDVRDNLNALVPQYATVTTAETTASAFWVDLATPGPSVTVPTLSRAIVIISNRQQNNTAGDFAETSYEVSGATTIAASTNWGLEYRVQSVTNPFVRVSRVHVRTDLTPGNNTFKMKYGISIGGTGTWSDREIFVIPAGPAQ